MPDSKELVVVDGGMGSIVACAAARARTLSMGSDGHGPTPVWLDRGRLLSDAPGFDRLFESLAVETLEQHPDPDLDRRDDQPASLTLLTATLGAADHGIAHVVWPIHAGVDGRPSEMDLELAARHVDTALLVTRLVALDSERHRCASIRVDTPYADFSDRQLAELALDLGTPFRMAPWWNDSSSEEYRRWRGVFEAIGCVAAG